MATRLRCSDRLVCIVVGHGYVKHINIVRGNIKASRNTPTLTERAPASSRQVTSWHRVIGWLALAVQYRWRRVRFHWPGRVGCRASFTVYVAKVPLKRRPLSFVFISWKNERKISGPGWATDPLCVHVSVHRTRCLALFRSTLSGSR